MLNVVLIFVFCAVGAYLISPSRRDAGKAEPDIEDILSAVRETIDRAGGPPRRS